MIVTPRKLHRPQPARRQRGMSLIFTLIAMVLLMLTSIALVRSVDTSTLVMGNLGFKQDATNLSSNSTAGSEAAIAYLVSHYKATDSTLYTSQQALGYYATSLDGLDPTGGTHDPTLANVDWNEDNCADAVKNTTYNGTCMVASPRLDVKDGSGNVVGSAKYVISRLCSTAGDPSGVGNMCSKAPGAGTTTSEARDEISGKNPTRPDITVVGPYFRIVVRAVGGRNTVSFTETLVHF
jgi:type IV pilus assembly protein PilX